MASSEIYDRIYLDSILYFFSKKNVYYELKIVYLLQLHKNALPQYELLYCMYIKVEKGG